jgi:Icc-related predicted phosphoesterase
MKILAFSDLHCDLDQAARLTEMAAEADLVIGAGDFASMHERLAPTIKALSAIEVPALLVPGNNETLEALRDDATAWPTAQVLHGEGAEIDGVTFFGLGGGIPTTPWDWSFDLSEEEATEALAGMAEGTQVLILHSPPHEACDSTGRPDAPHFGSRALRSVIEAKQPQLVFCGHIHEAWGQRAQVGASEIANLGPSGTFFEI